MNVVSDWMVTTFGIGSMDPVLSLAMTVHSSKGCYAVLLGSGASRSAGIPTGWEVILDLSRRLAKLLKEDCEPDPAAWFKTKFGTDPDYGDLLNKLAKSPTERSQLLRPYFEPTPQEREEGRKIATGAHRAIAKLVEQGFIKIIVTTNFDKLMELALEEVGVTPQVIASPDAVVGALPLAHSPCTVFKVHGDYLDSRIKNSPAELSKYHKNFNALLDRIFDEYGLIVCGWSADWDVALRAAIERCKGRRFSTYWVARGEPGDQAKSLISLRGAAVILTKGADEFFLDLEEKVASLDEIARPHPLSAKVAIATLKRYIVDEKANVRLADLVREETERAYARTCNSEFLKQQYPTDAAGIIAKFDFYNGSLAIPLRLMVHGSHWGGPQHVHLWMRMVERFAGAEGEMNQFTAAPDLRKYPVALLLYGGGIAALMADKYDTLAALVDKTQARQLNDVRRPAAMSVMNGRSLHVALQSTPNYERRYTPLSDYLCEQLREPFRDIEPDDHAYNLVFDRFEVLLALAVGNMVAGPSSTQQNVAQVRPTVALPRPIPVGRFAWRGWDNLNVLKLLRDELKSLGQNWQPLQAGMFGKDPDRVATLMDALAARVNELAWS